MKYLGVFLWSVVSALFLFAVMQYGKVYVNGNLISVSFIGLNGVSLQSDNNSNEPYSVTPFQIGNSLLSQDYYLMQENDEGLYILINNQV